MKIWDEKPHTFGSPIRISKRGSMGWEYDNEDSDDSEDIEEVSIDLSSSDERSNNGDEDVDNDDMQARNLVGRRVWRPFWWAEWTNVNVGFNVAN